MGDMKLQQAIAAASRKVGGALKADARNKEQGYEYISADKIVNLAGQALAENGIAIVPNITDSVIDAVVGMDKYNKERTRYDALVKFEFVLMHEGGESMRALWCGRGTDYAVPDKALYKAITSGHKYFLAKLLNIGEGNEDGENETQPELQPAMPQPVQKPTAAHVNGDIGYDQFEPSASMTMETAMAVKSTKGVPYGDIESETLSHMATSITKKLKAGGYDATEIDEATMKRDACLVILASRNNGKG